jgi:hypothetical protein
MSEILRIMPNSFAGFSREDALRQLAEEQKAEAERKRLEEEARRKAAAEQAERLRKEAEGGNVVPVSNVSGLGGIVFGESSAVMLNQPEAVNFAAQHGILQSAGEAVYARKVLNDPESREAQHTRTGAIYVVENGNAFVAFDDIADTTKNVVLR